MRNLFKWNTSVGLFFIAERFGRFHVMYDYESLGGYATPAQAAEEVAGGHTFGVSSGIDTATLGIPEDIREWERVASST